MALTDTAVRNAKPKDKPYKLADAQGCISLSIRREVSCGGSNIE
jgi:hypothetical protein